jgi:hypothetical protein
MPDNVCACLGERRPDPLEIVPGGIGDHLGD